MIQLTIIYLLKTLGHYNASSYLYTCVHILFLKPETLYHRDDALLYITYVMLIWAAPIAADRWHCSLWT